jgi:Bacterial pre-peptidase C-terminal domain
MLENTRATAVILPAGINVIQGFVVTDTDLADLYQFTTALPGQYQILSDFIEPGDSTLMLFNCAGNGLAGNDDAGESGRTDSQITINLLEAGVYYFSVSEFPGVCAFQNEAAAAAGTTFLTRLSGVLTSPTLQALGLVAPLPGASVFASSTYTVTITRLVGGCYFTPIYQCMSNCKPNCRPIELAYYVIVMSTLQWQRR